MKEPVCVYIVYTINKINVSSRKREGVQGPHEPPDTIDLHTHLCPFDKSKFNL